MSSRNRGQGASQNASVMSAPLIHARPEEPERRPLPEDSRPVVKTFTPMGDFVAVETYIFSKTEKGLILPSGVEDPFRCCTSRVVAVGPECKQVKEGDIVLSTPGTEAFFISHGESGRVVMCREKQLIGVSLVQFGPPEDSRPAEPGDIKDPRDNPPPEVPTHLRPNS